MYCLFNGEYGEHDLNIPSLEANLDTMEKNYAKWPGGVLPATVRYRMNKKGMTLEEAVLAKPMAKGRPKKNTQ